MLVVVYNIMGDQYSVVLRRRRAAVQPQVLRISTGKAVGTSFVKCPMSAVPSGWSSRMVTALRYISLASRRLSFDVAQPRDGLICHVIAAFPDQLSLHFETRKVVGAKMQSSAESVLSSG